MAEKERVGDREQRRKIICGCVIVVGMQRICLFVCLFVVFVCIGTELEIYNMGVLLKYKHSFFIYVANVLAQSVLLKDIFSSVREMFCYLLAA